jgi:signal transduction histidine kinase
MGAVGAGDTSPRLELDDLLSQVADRAQDALGTQNRLRELLTANLLIGGDLALPVTLRRIAEAAVELVHARYGALGVIAPGGGLEQFIHVGIDAELAAEIGHLPEGKGLLGALIDDPRPIRLRTMADDPRSVGFPERHPPMDSFLGVPIQIRDEVYGNLYLAEREGGAFTDEDQDLLLALAGAAASAIDNARLYAEAGHRQEWLAASTEITRQFLSAEGVEPLAVIARRLAELADADVVTVVLPTADGRELKVAVATGVGADELVSTSYPMAGTLSGLAISTGNPALVGDASDGPQPFAVNLSKTVPVGPVMAIPLMGQKGARGSLVVGRLHGRRRFSEADLEMATTFANHATVALELADARADQQMVGLLEERDRIARDLHDHVIQQLFAVGLSVQSVAAGLAGDERGARLERVVSDLDTTIRQIRTTIFELHGPVGPGAESIRERLMKIVAAAAPSLGFTPSVRLAGPIDAVVADDVAEDLAAVLRESLSNVARHAEASHVDVEVVAGPAQLRLDVIDNGRGIGEVDWHSGLANMRQRAERHGGSCAVTGDDGAHVSWTIPLTKVQ